MPDLGHHDGQRNIEGAGRGIQPLNGRRDLLEPLLALPNRGQQRGQRPSAREGGRQPREFVAQPPLLRLKPCRVRFIGPGISRVASFERARSITRGFSKSVRNASSTSRLIRSIGSAWPLSQTLRPRW